VVAGKRGGGERNWTMWLLLAVRYSSSSPSSRFGSARVSFSAEEESAADSLGADNSAAR